MKECLSSSLYFFTLLFPFFIFNPLSKLTWNRIVNYTKDVLCLISISGHFDSLNQQIFTEISLWVRNWEIGRQVESEKEEKNKGRETFLLLRHSKFGIDDGYINNPKQDDRAMVVVCSWFSITVLSGIEDDWTYKIFLG